MNKLLIHMMNAGDIDHRILPGLQKMQKAGQVRRFTMPAIQKDFVDNSSNDNLANPIAIRKKMQDDFIAKQNIAKRNAAQAAQDRQGYIRQAEPPRSAASKAWAIMTNPMTALAYKAQGRDIPDNFERGPKNSLDIAANIVNPFFYINEGKEFLKGVGNLGYKAVTDPFSLSGMDFLNTAMHGVGAIPLVAEGVQGANLLSQGLRGASKAYKGTAGMTSKMGRIKNAANAGAIELGYTPGDITGHSYFNIPADEVSKMMSKEMSSLPKGAYTFDGNMSKNSAPLFWTQAARSPKGFTVVNPGTTQGLNWSGTMGKRVSNALPKNIENIMPNAANYAEELKNRIDYLKKMGDPQSLQKAAALERDGISSQIVSDFPGAAMTDYNAKNSFGEFLNNYKTTLDNPIIEVNRKTGLNFPMTKVLDENIGKWTNDFYEQPSIYMVKGNPLSRLPKLIGDYAKKRTNAFFLDNPRTDFIRANTLYNAGKNLSNQGDYEMGGSYDEYGQPCYECGGTYAEGGYYDCPDQEKDPVTGKCKAEVVRGKEAAAANKAANADMNAWAKQVATMDKEIAKQNAAQLAGQLSFDYDWMGSPVDKAEKKAAVAGYKQFFQQNPNTFMPDDTSGYSPEQKYIIASKLKQRMSTPMGAKLVQQQFGIDPRFYDLQRLQTDFAPKMGGWNGMRNWLFNIHKQQGGPIVDPRGQWAHPGKVTRIPSDNITMQGVNYPVYGVGSNGQKQMMYPEQEYDFGGASYVDEYPMMQFGGGPLLGPMIPIMSKMAPKIASMFSGDPLKKFINWVNEPSETSTPTATPVKAPVRTYGYLDTHSEYRDRANDVYSELKNNDTKEYNSPKQISLSSGRFRGAKVDPEMINDIVNAAKANNVDPWVMLSLVGRESTFGSGASGNTLRAGNKQDLVSGWNVAEEYMPYEFGRFLADKQVPGVKVHKSNHGWQYEVQDKKAVDEYLKKNPQLIDSYYKKLEDTPDLGKLDSFTLAAQRIKKKGIQNYNPGDPKYSSMVNSDMGLLKQDAELKAYMKSKGYREGGQLGSGLLSKSVSCSNCGWSWKAVDGGINPMTCHKCGGIVKMQCGGSLPQYQGAGWVQKAANAEYSCPANSRADLRASAASVSGGSSDPLEDAKNNYWSKIKEDWQAQGVNKESFNNMYEDSLRAGPAFENPLSSQYFDPSTGKARPGTPGRLRYYKEAGYPLGNRLTLEQIKNTALEQPKGIKGYNKLVKEDYPWGVSPFIPSKLKDGGQPSLWDIIKMAQGGEMIRRADGSYSRRGLWDNIRANKGSGKKPTKQMLEQERKIKSKNK